MRLIDADALKKTLVDTPFYFRCETTPDMLTSVQDRLNDCLEVIDNMPTLPHKPDTYYQQRWKVADTITISDDTAKEMLKNAPIAVLPDTAMSIAPIWHDVDENPDDMPPALEPVLCRVRYKSYNSIGMRERYAIGYTVPSTEDGKIVKVWGGDATMGKYARVLRWQRIIDPLKEVAHE